MSARDCAAPGAQPRHHAEILGHAQVCGRPEFTRHEVTQIGPARNANSRPAFRQSKVLLDTSEGQFVLQTRKLIWRKDVV